MIFSYVQVDAWPPFGKRASHSVNHMISLLCIFVVLVVSHLGFDDGNLVLIAPVPGHCFLLFSNFTVKIVYEQYE